MSENSLTDEGQDKNDPLSLPSDSHVTHEAAQTAIEHTKNMSMDGSNRFSNIVQLWQFVKELLSQPQHSRCIYWIDRDQGIFKIIDSVKVAVFHNRVRKSCLSMGESCEDILSLYWNVILLLESPCPLVRSSVRDVFYTI